MFEIEEWRMVQDFPNYLISSYGRVRYKDRPEPRQVTINAQGFPVVVLFSGTVRNLRHINKLVASEFVPLPDILSRHAYKRLDSVWHIDGNLQNCQAGNLKWDTRSHVIEWNNMHRSLEPKFHTPEVKNNRTGIVYANAYECAMADGVLESSVVWQIERVAQSMFSESSRYRYVTSLYPAEKGVY